MASSKISDGVLLEQLPSQCLSSHPLMGVGLRTPSTPNRELFQVVSHTQGKGYMVWESINFQKQVTYTFHT